MRNPDGSNKFCRCGKVMFTKIEAQTKRNWLLKRGNERYLRIYPCPESNTWHLTKTMHHKGRKYNDYE